jgi:hypothetical protein
MRATGAAQLSEQALDPLQAEAQAIECALQIGVAVAFQIGVADSAAADAGRYGAGFCPRRASSRPRHGGMIRRHSAQS